MSNLASVFYLLIPTVFAVSVLSFLLQLGRAPRRPNSRAATAGEQAADSSRRARTA